MKFVQVNLFEGNESFLVVFVTGLPHTQGNSGNFKIIENLRETQRIFIFPLNSGKF